MNAHSLIILSNGGDITSESKHFFFFYFFIIQSNSIPEIFSSNLSLQQRDVFKMAVCLRANK